MSQLGASVMQRLYQISLAVADILLKTVLNNFYKIKIVC